MHPSCTQPLYSRFVCEDREFMFCNFPPYRHKNLPCYQWIVTIHAGESSFMPGKALGTGHSQNLGLPLAIASGNGPLFQECRIPQAFPTSCRTWRLLYTVIRSYLLCTTLKDTACSLREWNIPDQFSVNCNPLIYSNLNTDGVVWLIAHPTIPSLLTKYP
jgi:hypothetical protein